MSTPEELLRPSLQAVDAKQKAIYSSTAGYLTAFFGGPVAAVGMGALNSWRLDRLRKDAWMVAAGAIVAVAAHAFLLRPGLFGAEALVIEPRNARIAARVLALALFGAFWLLHKRYYRGMELMGTSPPNPWPVAIACGAADLLLTIALKALLSE